MSIPEVLSALDRIHGTVSVIGSMNADYTVTAQRLPGPGETITGGPLQLLPGGKSGNQAAAAAKIGAAVRMFGAVGSDSNADFLLEQLEQAGVDVSNVRRVLGPSGTTVIVVDAEGENIIVYSPGSNAQVTVDYVHSMKEQLVSSSVLGLCLESPIETVTVAAQMCHEAGVKVLLNDSPFIDELPHELIEAVDILLVSQHEVAQLLGMPDEDVSTIDWFDAVSRFEDYGFDRVVVTLGASGSIVIENGNWHRVSAVQVKSVDATGCIDSFMGTVLAGLAAGYTLLQSAQMGSYVSAYAATKLGAQSAYGSATEVINYFSDGK